VRSARISVTCTHIIPSRLITPETGPPSVHGGPPFWDHPPMPETHPPRSEEPAHDILAAEAFAMPAPDPTIHHGPVQLPGDPTGIEEPHDVLAAEEFPMPAPTAVPSVRPRKASHRIGIVAAGLLLLFAIRRLRS
jgi:hypothetical protein